MPALGRLTDVRTVKADLLSMELREFRRALLNEWPEQTEEGWKIIPRDVWKPREMTRSTAERGYGADHEKERAWWAPVVAAGDGWCHAEFCLYDSRRIPAGSAWDLGHNVQRTAWIGPTHMRCNRSEGARRGNRARGARRDASRLQRRETGMKLAFKRRPPEYTAAGVEIVQTVAGNYDTAGIRR